MQYIIIFKSNVTVDSGKRKIIRIVSKNRYRRTWIEFKVNICHFLTILFIQLLIQALCVTCECVSEKRSDVWRHVCTRRHTYFLCGGETQKHIFFVVYDGVADSISSVNLFFYVYRQTFFCIIFLSVCYAINNNWEHWKNSSAVCMCDCLPACRWPCDS